MSYFNSRNIRAFFAVPAILGALCAVIGGVLSFTPVPISDMWESYLAADFKRTNVLAWWEQHNEHRIVFTRLLFWLDEKLCAGSGVLLGISNYLLLLGIYVTLCQCLRYRLVGQAAPWVIKVFALMLMSLEFCWLQQENLVWNFQSQFLLAQWLPLLAFLLLYQAFRSGQQRYFIAACIVGISALGSMANGVLTLPLMALLALLLGMGWQRISLLTVLAVLGAAVYFYGYHSPVGHGSLSNALLYQPWDLLRYILLYLGAPFYFLSGQIAYQVAQVAGLFLIGSAGFFAWRSLRQAQHDALNLMLLVYLLYIGGSALATAGSRLLFGLQQALSGRYATPALIAWSVLLILYAPCLAKRIQTHTKVTLVPLFLLQLLFFLPQLSALESKAKLKTDYLVAALAVELGINDEAQIQSIFPSAQTLLSNANTAIAEDRGIFGQSAIKNAQEMLQRNVAIQLNSTCLGYIDSYQRFSDLRYVRVSGWLYNQERGNSPERLLMLNTQGKVIGIALTGSPRPDLVKAVHPKAVKSGFLGYLSAEYVGQTVILQDEQGRCGLQVTANLSADDQLVFQLIRLAQKLSLKTVIQHLSPGIQHLLAQQRSEQSATDWLQAVTLPIGQQSQAAASNNNCEYQFGDYQNIAADTRFVELNGEMRYPDANTAYEGIEILDATGKVVGYAFAMRSAANSTGSEGRSLRIKGYLLTEQLGQAIFMRGLQSGCQAQTRIAALAFQLRPIKPEYLTLAASSQQISANNGWSGTDASHTQIPGFEVFGSYVQSDQDTGNITLSLHRGDVLFYRSGPTAGGQLLSVAGQATVMPIVPDWTVIEFSGPQLPPEFSVTLTDQGNSWGEWSAIGLRH